MRQQAPAEQRFRQQQQDGGKAEQLHREVGENGAGITEQIVDRRLRRVAQRGVLHRPGGERDGAEQRQRDQRQSGKFAQAAAQMSRKCSERKATTSRLRSVARMRYILSPSNRSTATRRCSASAVAALSCTMATRI